MDEELVRNWEKLKLTDEEENVIVQSDSAEEEGFAASRIALSLVGKLLTNKPYNVEAMKRVLKNLWRLLDNVAIRVIDTNLYVFQFFCDEDKNKVLEGRPWAFDNHMLLLKEIEEHEQPSDVIFETTPFWIRMLDVPFGLRNAKFAKEIGESMGGFLEFDDSDPLGWEEVMRVKVLIHINKPLRRGFKVATGHTAAKWVGIKYERLGDFCYFCGRLGHIDKECLDQEQCDKETALVFQYGPYLVASPMQRSRVDVNEREKEKKWLENLKNRRSTKKVVYNDPDAIRLGPPGAARKLFSSPPHTHQNTSMQPRAAKLVPVIDKVTNKTVLRPAFIGSEPMQGVEEEERPYEHAEIDARMEDVQTGIINQHQSTHRRNGGTKKRGREVVEQNVEDQGNDLEKRLKMGGHAEGSIYTKKVEGLGSSQALEQQ